MKDITRYVSDAVLDQVIADLKGTCQTLGEALAPFGIDELDLTVADLQYIEEEIFLCSRCGWWCEQFEAHELDGETVCDDCYVEEEDE